MSTTSAFFLGAEKSKELQLKRRFITEPIPEEQNENIDNREVDPKRLPPRELSQEPPQQTTPETQLQRVNTAEHREEILNELRLLGRIQSFIPVRKIDRRRFEADRKIGQQNGKENQRRKESFEASFKTVLPH